MICEIKFAPLLFALFLLLGTSGAQSAEPTSTMVIQEPWSNVFGGKDAIFHARFTADESFDGRIVWRYAADGRTIARGERAVKAGPSAPGITEVCFSVPPVKPGVIIQTTLSICAVSSGSDKEIANLDKTLWVFPDDPFAGRAEWLKALKIRLFDPSGATAKLFTEAGIPFTETRNSDALEGGGDSLLIVGEGVSFKEYRGLAANLIKAAAAGQSVLCLSPDSGDILLPGTEDSALPQPLSLIFSRRDFIKQLDKRLDAAWRHPVGQAGESGLKLRGNRGSVIVEIAKDGGGWPLMETRYDKGHGKFVICGFGIVGAWADSPTPRFFLVKVLEHVSGNKMKE